MKRSWIFAALVAALIFPATLSAADGQADLDQATDRKLTAETVEQLSEVINLVQQALDKGLDEENTLFAKQLLASSLSERGLSLVEMIFKPERPDPRWQQMRRLALADLERSLRAIPQQPKVLIAIARLETLPGGDEERALSAVDQAVRCTADDADEQVTALLLRAALRENPADKLADIDRAIAVKPTDPQPIRARGALRMSQEKGEEALADFDAALKLDPNHALTHEARGAALAMLERFAEAREAYGKAIELEPENVSARMQRAQLSLAQEKYEDLIDDATQLLELDRGQIGVRILRAQAYLQIKRFKEAEEDVRQVLDARPDAPPALRLLAQVHVAQDKIDEAIADLRQILRHQPDDLDTIFQIAMLYRSQKNFARALALFDELIEKEPKAWFVRYGRADTYLSLGKHRQALDDYNLALKGGADDSGMLNNLAWLLCTSPDDSIRDGKRAVELATKACELTKHKAAHILSTLAAAHAETGDFDKARQWAQKALEVSREDLKDHLNKELASYEAKKPWRERLNEDQEVSEKPGTNSKR